jgi:hypothetical protein
VDLTRRKVHRAGSLKVGVHDAAGVVVGGRDLVFGGGSTAVSNVVQDITRPGAPRVIGRLPQPRADLVAASDGTATYILAGYDGTQGSTSILRTTNGSRFTRYATLPISVRYPAVALTAGVIWLFGGEHNGAQTSAVQRIDLATGKSRVVGHLPRRLAHAGAFVLGSSIFIAGGRTGSAATGDVLRFDPITLGFSSAGRLPGPRSDFGVVVVAGTAYLVGGENAKPLATIVKIRPSTRATR